MASFKAEGSAPEGQRDRSRTTSDRILASLEDLASRDFRRFKDKLSDFSYEDEPPIPWGRLEDADWVTTKNLMVDSYGEKRALKVTVEVLRAISLIGPAEELLTKIQQHGVVRTKDLDNRLQDCRESYMTSVKEKYQSHKDGNARLGESVHLEKRYTNLLLIKKLRDVKEREHEIMALGQKHLDMMEDRSSNEYSPITIEGLFDPGEDEIVPKVVVLQGPAGVGKTMTSQKIMLDWASGKLFQDKFSFVFYLSCRELNTISGELSLAGLLRRMCRIKCEEGLLKQILSDDQKKLFIVDGFDELAWCSVTDSEVCDDPFLKTSKETLFNSLFGEPNLCEASMIITTRPYSLERLTNILNCPRCVEILGFTGTERVQFFYNFFGSKTQGDMALGKIKPNDTLFTMCAVPVICWIVCTVLKQQMADGKSEIICKTTTSIYLLYLKSLLKYHSRNSNQSTVQCVRKLCSLANEGIWNQKILFEEDDIRRHGLSLSEIESVFLNQNIFQRDIETQTCYSFIHLSMQEFLAALYYVPPGKRKITSLFSPRNKEVERLLEEVRNKSHLQLTVQFLFGLSGEIQLKEIAKMWGTDSCSFREKTALEEWLRENKNYVSRLKYLYEAHDEDLTGRIMSHFPDVVVTNPPYNFDYGALSYCLKSGRSKRVIFVNCQMGPQIRALLSAALLSCPHVRFSCCIFPDEDDYKKWSPLTPSLSGLFRSQLGIQNLTLYECSLKTSCWDDLCPIILNKSLVRLEISVNCLQDSGIKTLCKALKQRDCILQELRLRDCALTSLCCADLRSVIIMNRTLTILDLSKNNIDDSGLKLLYEGLNNPGCTLEKLYLESCGFTFSNGEDLSNLIRSQALKLFDVSSNNLQDSGIKLLCKGLQDSRCNLLELSVHSCGLTPSACEDLRSVFMTNRSLIKLDLRSNKLQDSGVKLLCEGLRHPGCTLQELKLQSCHLTSSCCPDISSVIATNKTMHKLVLLNNNLQDSGIKLLCEGLRHKGDALQELWVSRKNVSWNLAESERKCLLKWLRKNVAGDTGTQGSPKSSLTK